MNVGKNIPIKENEGNGKRVYSEVRAGVGNPEACMRRRALHELTSFNPIWKRGIARPL